jgi:tripartite-type tricarboxylate transporter receptor subunit TctC
LDTIFARVVLIGTLSFAPLDVPYECLDQKESAVLRHQSFAVLAAAAVATIITGAEARADAGDFYRGKTITYIVATAPGGGYDGYARLIAQYMEPLLPGTKIIIRNVPGAGHMIGTNMLYASKPDGLTLGTFNIGLVYSQLIKARGVQFDLTKLAYLGKAAEETRVLVAGTNSPYRTFADIQASKTAVPFVMSGIGSAGNTELQLLARVFDLNLKMLYGYSGGDDDMAIMRGEAVGRLGAFASLEPFVKNGYGRFVLQIGGTKKPGYEDVTLAADIAKTPQAKSVVKLIESQGEISRVTAVAPGVPADRLTYLRDAYRKALESPALLADAKKREWPIEPMYGEAVTDLIREALNQPPEVIAMIEAVNNAKPKDVTVTAKLTKVADRGAEIEFTDGGKPATAKLSGSRTKVTIASKDAARGDIKAGMTCEVTYTGPGSEASLVACN